MNKAEEEVLYNLWRWKGLDPTEKEMKMAIRAMKKEIAEDLAFLDLWTEEKRKEFLEFNGVGSVAELKELLLDHVNRKNPIRAMASDLNGRVHRFHCRGEQ